MIDIIIYKFCSVTALYAYTVHIYIANKFSFEVEKKFYFKYLIVGTFYLQGKPHKGWTKLAPNLGCLFYYAPAEI